VLLLARDDIKVNLKNACGRIPLLFTAVYGHETVMQLLLARDNINVDLRNYEGQTPLLVVSEEGHEALKLLLARDDVNVNVKARRIRIITQHYRGLITRRSHAGEAVAATKRHRREFIGFICRRRASGSGEVVADARRH